MRVLLALAAATAVLLCGTAWHVASAQRRSAGCEMTYMYAQYVPIPVEGDTPPSGHPALFIPGNAGSYQQVRSIASETSREWRRRAARRGGAAGGPDIDWYVIDTNEELSAFDSVLLEHQAAFALACLRHLAARYALPRPGAGGGGGGGGGAGGGSRGSGGGGGGDGSSSGSGVGGGHAGSGGGHAGSSHAGPGEGGVGGGILLFGHSMGGVVARLALLSARRDPYLGPRAASLLLTAASPQAASPVMLHPAMGRLYRRLADEGLPGDVPVISINGGARDLQVAEPLTSLRGLAPDATLAFEASAPDVPGVWAQAGHNEIAWCNQLLRRLAVLLLSLLEPRGAGGDDAGGGGGGGAQPRAMVGRAEAQAGAAGEASADEVRQQEGTRQQQQVQAQQQVQQQQQQQHTRPRRRGADRHRRDGDAALIRFFLHGRAVYSLAAAPLAAAAAAEAAAAPNATAAAFAPPFAGPRAALDAAVGPRPCLSRGLPSNAAAAARGAEEAAHDASLFLNGSQQSAAGGGRLLTWDAAQFRPGARGGLLVAVSAAKPCEGFRLWLELPDGRPEAGAGRPAAAERDRGARGNASSDASSGGDGGSSGDGGRGGGGGGGGGAEIDLSHLAAPLPCVDAAAALRVKDPEKWQDVLKGRDYLTPSAWLLRVPAPLLARAARVHLWLAPKGSPPDGGGGAGGARGPWASAAVQWLGEWPGEGGPPGEGPGPAAGRGGPGGAPAVPGGELRLGPAAALRAAGAARSEGGPAVLRLRLSWPALTRHASLRWQATGGPVSGCWAPALISADADGGGERVRAAVGAADALPLSPGAAGGGGGGGGGGEGEGVRLVLLDPRCGYRLWLGWDVFGPLWTLLLGHSSVALGLGVALLLLALSHQLSALVQLAAAEAGAQLPDSFWGSCGGGGSGVDCGGGGSFSAAGPLPAGGRESPPWPRRAPSLSLGGANLAPPAPTSFRRSLDSVLSDRRVWLAGAALLLSLLALEWAAGGGRAAAVAAVAREAGAAGDPAAPLRAALRAALGAAGLRRLMPRPHPLGVAFLALVAVTLLLLSAQLTVWLKCACGGVAALALRLGRRAAAAAAPAPGCGGGGGTGGGVWAALPHSDAASAALPAPPRRLTRSLLAAPAALLAACVAGPPGGRLRLGCAPLGARRGTRGGGGGGGAGGGQGAVAAAAAAAWPVLRGVAQLLLAALLCTPHPAIGLGLAISVVFVTWTPPRITALLIQLSKPEVPLAALLRAPAPPPPSRAASPRPAPCAASPAGASAPAPSPGAALLPAGSAALDGGDAAPGDAGAAAPAAAAAAAAAARLASPFGPASLRAPSRGSLRDAASAGGAAAAGGALSDDDGPSPDGVAVSGGARVAGRGSAAALRRAGTASRSCGRLSALADAAVALGPPGAGPRAGAALGGAGEAAAPLLAAAARPPSRERSSSRSRAGGLQRGAAPAASLAPSEVERMRQLMHQGWLLLYGCCLLLLLPSFVAWLKLPFGQHHAAHPLDALACAPIVLHCLALARGGAAAYSGLPRGWFFADIGGGAGGGSIGGGGGGGGAGGAWDQGQGPLPPPHALHKRCLRLLAAWVFLGSLQAGACGALAACSAAAALMLAGHGAAGAAAAAWRRAGGGAGGRAAAGDAALKKRG
ncbi:hypothetical protein Rsub_02168 [Raphidocelis subcapitata]|uniref:GPI inositol-deacylase PGAP1-like alpha/beta domain-containing protein n=1 Tax=Raphidocelis subcapitata TaxID=307507 RepID=A0A2V0NNV8_9CHLO|nr:hypothetical protein Rsub_02168 [Raphidocelis subcapitata]|eukprot:GBF89291.1 hypothetical protein Rsub_02168 [Raphidocelis subcapitata]